MGASPLFPPPRLTDAERIRLARRALAEGTARQLRALNGISRLETARYLGVHISRLEAWEQGEDTPPDSAALKLWHYLVTACRTGPAA